MVKIILIFSFFEDLKRDMEKTLKSLTELIGFNLINFNRANKNRSYSALACKLTVIRKKYILLARIKKVITPSNKKLCRDDN